MAFNKRLLWTFSAFIFVPSLQGVYGAVVCEMLHSEVCAFSVSSSGTRCVLEKSILSNGDVQYDCQSSEVIADEITEWIETVECTNACGSERMTVGMSSDALIEGGFIRKLCSPRCYNNCPNIVNLYFNLAAGEGIYLPRLCEAHRSANRRVMGEVPFSFALAMSPMAV
eukprot:PITA_15894